MCQLEQQKRYSTDGYLGVSILKKGLNVKRCKCVIVLYVFTKSVLM